MEELRTVAISAMQLAIARIKFHRMMMNSEAVYISEKTLVDSVSNFISA